VLAIRRDIQPDRHVFADVSATRQLSLRNSGDFFDFPRIVGSKAAQDGLATCANAAIGLETAG